MIRSRGCSAGAGRGIRPSYLLARNGCAALIIIIDTAPHSEGAVLVDPHHWLKPRLGEARPWRCSAQQAKPR